MVLCMLAFDTCILSLWHITDTITWEPVLSEIEVLHYYCVVTLCYVYIINTQINLPYTARVMLFEVGFDLISLFIIAVILISRCTI